MSEQNIAVALKYWNAANSHDPDGMKAVLATDYVHHDPNLPVPDADRDTHVQIIAGGFFSAFPDLHMTIHDFIAEGDKVVVRWSFTGTHNGEVPGNPPLPATGKQIGPYAIAIHRVAGDKLAETWVTFDALRMMQELGVIPTPG